MPLDQPANQTDTTCTGPLLDLAAFSETNGYIAGRYCSVTSSEDGAICCFPCPIQDSLYSPNWQKHFRIPNYLSILSVALCLFLMVSFAVLPSDAMHRHYLSVGLLFPVLFISLSFAIPVTGNPDMCYDAITPHDMHSSMLCAWTGSLVTLGGIGSVVWVFLRCLSLHIRIFWDRDPGPRFKWGSIFFGTMVPLACLIAVLSVTGLSYRMGQTCLPNHDHAIVTFWIWLVLFAVLAFVLQTFTSGYCFYVYIRSLRHAKGGPAIGPSESAQASRKTECWRNVKKMFTLQWRNIFISVFVLVGCLTFFIVFWTQDGRQRHMLNEPTNIEAMIPWILCQKSRLGNENECRGYLRDVTVNQAAVLASLIFASLVGVSIFVLLFHATMLKAWLAVFTQLRRRHDRPATPQLTSLDDAEKYQQPYPRRFTSIFRASTLSKASSPKTHNIKTLADTSAPEIELSSIVLDERRIPNRISSDAGLLPYPNPARLATSIPSCRLHIHTETLSPTVHVESAHAFKPSVSQIQPTSPLSDAYTPTRAAPLPPALLPPSAGSTSNTARRHNAALGTTRGLKLQRTPSQVRGRISAPIPASFVHVRGAFLGGTDADVEDGRGLGVKGVAI